MNLTGLVFEYQETVLAQVVVTDGPSMTDVSVTMSGTEVIKFPLTLGLDADLIASRIGNVINQTGLIDRAVRVDLTEA